MRSQGYLYTLQLVQGTALPPCRLLLAQWAAPVKSAEQVEAAVNELWREMNWKGFKVEETASGPCPFTSSSKNDGNRLRF